MQILIDMDGVLADFEQGFLNTYRRLNPDQPYIPLEKRNTFYIDHQYQAELGLKVFPIILRPGFYRSLPPIKGAIEAIKKLEASDHEVFICTSPLSKYKNCVLEKYEWVEEHLGFPFTKKIILAKDKTTVRGDILIDDKPEITGVMKPVWEQYIFDQPYNREVTDKVRMGWGDLDKYFFDNG